MSLSSVIKYVQVDSTSTGLGLTGKVYSDFTAKYLVEGGTLTSLTPQDITTLGTYQAPSANTNVRIKEVSSSDPAKGVYEVHFHDDQVAVAGKNLLLMLSVSGGTEVRLSIPLYDLPGRVPAALTSNGNIKSSLMEIISTALTETTGQIAAAFKQFFDVSSPTGTMKYLTRVALADTLTTYTGNTPQTADNNTKLADIQSRLPAALTGDGNIKADVLKIEGADPTDTIRDSVIDNNVLVKTTIATLADQTSFTLTAGSADDDAYNGSRFIVTNAAGTKKCEGLVYDYDGGTKGVTLSADPAVFTMAVGDTIAIMASSVNVMAIHGTPQAAGIDVPAELAKVPKSDGAVSPNATAITAIQNGLATPTNITAGTITTVTNLTNAPTNGDLTATMKTSVGTAVAASAVASVTGNVGGNVAGSVGSLATQAKADVNAEVVDVLNVDTYAEPGQETPAATNTLVKKIGYIFKFLRNKKTQTATTKSIYNAGGTVVDQKSTVSDDGTTFTDGEIGTGP